MIRIYALVTCIFGLLNTFRPCAGGDASDLRRFLLYMSHRGTAVSSSSYPSSYPPSYPSSYPPSYPPSYGGPPSRTLAETGPVDQNIRLHRALEAYLNQKQHRSMAEKEERLSWIEAEEKARLFSRYLSAPPQSLPHQVRVLPPGQCYCRFDYDWSEWSLSEEACKVALFQRARDPTSGLDQRMLVSYYDYKPSKVSGVLQPPHADQISAFLYSDCTPTPPCSCMGSMGNKLSQACINEIQIYAADPSRNVPSEILHDAVTEGNDDGRQIRAWAHLTFPTSSCDNFQGHPYVFVQLKTDIWADAWQRALGIGPWEGSPVLVVQILLASICFLVVLASLLVLKRLVQPCDK